jgi:acyl transferase domain-containing protein/acyl-CoA synthetase (AMP-forming)/AMP-acid ligase II
MIAVPAPAVTMATDGPRIRAAAADCAAAMVLCARPHAGPLGELFGQDASARVVSFEEARRPAAEWREPRVEDTGIAFLQYTSGSTSEPKGVAISHGALMDNLALCHEANQLHPDSVIVSWLPHFFDLALVAVICLGPYSGGTVVQMAPEHFLQKPLRWLRALDYYHGGMALAPNFAFDLCVETVRPEERDQLDLHHWVSVICGGERVNPATMERFAAYFAPCGFRAEYLSPAYGLAEATLAVTVSAFGKPPVVFSVDGEALGANRIVRAPEDAPRARRIAGLGQVPETWEIAIVHPETGQRSAPDELGEIWIRGKGLASGYWNRPEQTAETFGGILADGGGGPYLRTGDLGALIDGELVVTGRLKDVIVIRGFNHHAQDLEQSVHAASPELGASPCAAFAVQDAEAEALVIAVEVPAGEGLDRLGGMIRQHIGAAHGITPETVVFVRPNGIPRTSTGKIQRGACRRSYEKGELDEWGRSTWRGGAHGPASGEEGSFARPSEAEIRLFLRQMVARYLGVGVDEIDPRATFRALGLDSTTAVRLTGEVSAFIGRSITPNVAFDHPSIDALARYLSLDGAIESSLSRVCEGTSEPREPIAIVGMACRFPGGPDLDSFWALLRAGGDAIREVPPDRWNLEAVYDADPSTTGRMHTRWGGFIDDVDQFDAAFFRMSGAEAAGTDPQQRLVLEVVWEALEHAGIAPDSLFGSPTGVFAGIGTVDYISLQLLSGAPNDVHSAVGVSQSIASNRLSYILGLQGPSVSLDTACSSALTAIHWAVGSLRRRECSMAIAAAVNLMLAPMVSVRLSQARMLSPSGRCRTFDAAADGYTRGEGCGAVILKRLRDAVADGDHIYAVLRGSAINHSGHTNGITAPSSEAQAGVMRAALADAGVEPEQVDYVEAHGTGTPLGDPIEFTSITEAVLRRRDPEHPCRIASVKTNVGHLEVAAGMAGLIKTVLSLERQETPPHLHLNNLNPMISLDGLPGRIPTALEPWPRCARARIAAVNAFGFGGTNACLIIEEGPEDPGADAALDPMLRPKAVLTLSGHNEEALRAQAVRYAGWLKAHPDADLNGVCLTAALGRTHFGHRLAVVTGDTGEAASREALANALDAFAAGEAPPDLVSGKAPLEPPAPPAFLFTGQGAQYPGMTRRLFETEPVFRAVLQRCEEILQPVLDPPLLDVLFSEGGTELIHQARFAQPALFAIEYALAELWASWGIQPGCLLGHSIGEIAAACRAGAFSLDDGLRIAAERGRLMQSLPPGGTMATVFAEEAVVEEVIAPHANLVIAAYNGPGLQVISGPEAAVGEAMAAFGKAKIRAKRMTVSHAFHSPLMEPILDAFASFVQNVDFHPLSLPLYSTVRSARIPAGTLLGPEYWTENIRHAVCFAAAVKALSTSASRQFIEIGPDAVLTGMARRVVSIDGADWLPSVRRNQDDNHTLLHALATLYVRGHKPDWRAVSRPARRVVLPSYPFQRKRCWMEYGQEDPRTFGIPGVLAPDAALGAALTPQQERELARSLVKLDWTPVEVATPIAGGSPQQWLLIGADVQQGEALAEAIEAAGHAARFVHVDAGAQLSPAEISGYWRGWNVSASQGTPRNLVFLSDGRAYEGEPGACLSLLHVLQYALEQPSNDPVRVTLVTRGAHAIAARDRANPAETALWGLGRTASLESPGLMARMLDLATDGAPTEVICSALLAETCEAALSWREGVWYGARLDHFTPERRNNAFRPRKDASYLITGGFGALGLATARWLAQQGARRLVLMGRTPLPPRNEWKDLPENSPVRDRIQAVLEVERLGASVQMACVDAGDAPSLEAWFAQFEQEQHPPIRGVFHLAGTLADASLGRLTAADFEQVFRPKAAGAWNLHRLFLERELDCFVLFSSVAGLLGAPGQGNYAAANAWLDGLALHRRAEGLPALSIAWGPWGAAGMAARPDRISRMERLGMRAIEPGLGVAALGLLAGQIEISHAGMINADWGKLGAGFQGAATLLERMMHDVTETPRDALAALARQASGAERQTLLEQLLRERIARMFGVAQDEIVLDKSPEALGIDSLAAMDLVRELSKALDFVIVAREFFRHPTLLSFIRHVGDEMDLAMGGGEDDHVADGSITERLLDEQRPHLSFQNDPVERNPRAAFVLSSPRSGSTLLRAMLSANPALFAPQELHLLWFQDMKERQEAFHGVLGDKGLGFGLARAVMDLRGLDGPAAEAAVQDWIAAQTPVAEIYRTLQQEAAPRLLVDKSPSYALSPAVLRRAEALFDPARFIYLYRHPYAVMESVGRQRLWNWFDLENVAPQVLAEETWAVHNRNILDFLDGIPRDRQLWVAFEELVARPEPIMKSICAFLGVPYAESMLSPYAQSAIRDDAKSGKTMAGDPNFLKRSEIDSGLGEKWREVIPERAVGALTRRIAERLEYPLPGPVLDAETAVLAGREPMLMDEEQL